MLSIRDVATDDLSSMQLKFGASNNCKMRNVMPFICKVMQNKTAVEPNTTEQLRTRNQNLSDHFSLSYLQFEEGFQIDSSFKICNRADNVAY